MLHAFNYWFEEPQSDIPSGEYDIHGIALMPGVERDLLRYRVWMKSFHPARRLLILST
jgi:hypothetical protein